jgi:hypothetical protein
MTNSPGSPVYPDEGAGTIQPAIPAIPGRRSGKIQLVSQDSLHIPKTVASKFWKRI